MDYRIHSLITNSVKIHISLIIETRSYAVIHPLVCIKKKQPLSTCSEKGSHLPCSQVPFERLKGNSHLGRTTVRGRDGSGRILALSNQSKSHCLPAFSGENSSGSKFGRRYFSSMYSFIDSGVSARNAGGWRKGKGLEL